MNTATTYQHGSFAEQRRAREPAQTLVLPPEGNRLSRSPFRVTRSTSTTMAITVSRIGGHENTASRAPFFTVW
jgi:hypothetical protein